MQLGPTQAHRAELVIKVVAPACAGLTVQRLNGLPRL